jgi:hypothetical protein
VLENTHASARAVESEVADAEIDEHFNSEPEAKARFDELVLQRFDHEIVNLYRIGTSGIEISERTERGRQQLTGNAR